MSTGLKVNVFIGCYATYNAGYLFDKQYTVTSADELSEAIEAAEKHHLESLKKARPDWLTEGYITDHYCEELYAANYEIYFDGEFLDLDFGESLYDLMSWLENDAAELDQLNNSFGLLLKIKDNLGTDKSLIEIDQEVHIIEIEGHNVDEELGYIVAEETCMLDGCPDHIKNYFNYEQFGYDLIAGGDYFTIEFNNTTYAIDNHSV